MQSRDGMHHAKNRGNKEIPLAILSRILAQSCVSPLPELCTTRLARSRSPIKFLDSYVQPVAPPLEDLGGGHDIISRAISRVIYRPHRII